MSTKRWDSGFGIWAFGLVTAAAVLMAAPGPAAAQDWDTNKLVNEAHNLEEAVLPRVRQQADGGDAHAQALLGLAYEMGAAGLMADPVQALAWFNKVAAQGVAWGEMWAGDFYYTGSPGVPKDLYKAVELYKRAAEHGDPKAAFNVGRMYFFGEGVALNMATAADWFRRALPAEPGLVGRMVALSEVECDAPFCIALRQILGAMTTESGDQYAGEWDDMTHEWDAVKVLPDFDRCGFTSSNRTENGNVQNYFCDTEVITDTAVGAATAKQMADAVERAVGTGWSRGVGIERADAYFFSRDGFPRVRITYNTTLGDAPQRVTLLVGP
jgi:hypothetical protein